MEPKRPDYRRLSVISWSKAMAGLDDIGDVPTYVDSIVSRCPFALNARLREEQPVFHDPVSGIFHLTRYEDVRRAARDHVRFSSNVRFAFERDFSPAAQAEVDRIYSEEGCPPKDTLVAIDPPEHKRYRALVDRVFTPRRVRDLEPDIRDISNELVDTFRYSDEIEFIDAFAVRMPSIVIADQLGVHRSEAHLMREFSAALMASHVPNPTVEHEIYTAKLITKVQAFFANKLKEVEASGRDCILSALAKAEVDGRKLDRSELLSTAFFLMVGGNDTTSSALGSAMKYLIERPDLFEMLKCEPKKIPVFVEEVLRLRSPNQGLLRCTTEDVDLRGVHIPAGSIVCLRWGSGNHDPLIFDNPEEIDLERANPLDHLAFGHGSHFCIGNQLARAELRIAVEIFCERLTDLRFARDADDSVSLAYIPFSYALQSLKLSCVVDQN